MSSSTATAATGTGQSSGKPSSSTSSKQSMSNTETSSAMTIPARQKYPMEKCPDCKRKYFQCWCLIKETTRFCHAGNFLGSVTKVFAVMPLNVRHSQGTSEPVDYTDGFLRSS
ncbi:hypothetical protein DL765_006342 [Monosporascus sp. GIB2]|nr:hypothetical protein DL765_006342 [Monosporascus sp. GIB2]